MIRFKQQVFGVALPESWKGLFNALGSGRFQEEKADIWYSESTGSEYGHKPVWNDVLKALTIHEPYIDEDKAILCFKPRMLHLPVYIQVRFLQFFHRHCSRIPDKEINMFLGKIVPYLTECSDLTAQLKLIQGSVKHDLQVTGLFKDWEKTTERIEGSDIEKNDKVTEIGELAGKLKTDTAADDDDDGDDDDDDVIVIDDDDCEPITKRRRLEGSWTTHSNDICMDIVHEEIADKCNLSAITSCTIDKVHDKSTEVILNCSRNDGKKNGHESDTESAIDSVKTNDISMERENEFQLSQIKGQAVEKLKEVWHNGGMEKSADEELKVFVAFNSEEMKIAIDQLELENLSEEAAALACSQVATVSEMISYDNCVSFLNCTLCGKVMALTENASRVLVGAVSAVANTYPKQLIDGILVPCFKSSFASPQVDLILRLLKENLNESNQLNFFSKLLDSKFDVTDSKIALIQSLIEAVNINSELMQKLLRCFEIHSQSLKKNLKFGKLLLAVANKHGGVMESESLAKFSSLADTHQTFLKKSIDNVIKKLKT